MFFFEILAIHNLVFTKIVSEYDQEIQQSQTADKPMAFPEEQPHSHNETPGRQPKQNHQLSLPHQEEKETCSFCNKPHSLSMYSHRASNTFYQVVEAKRFEGVFLWRKVC